MESIALRRLLPKYGIASRAEAARWIAAGRVTVDGEAVVDPERPVAAESRIALDGRVVGPIARVTWMLHKPRGVVTTTKDPEGRRTVLDLLPPDLPRLFPVGRLDRESSGLLLLTNDGEMAFRVLHGAPPIAKVYRVVVKGEVAAERLEPLRLGAIELDGRPLKPVEAEVVAREERTTALRLVLREGRHRQIRRSLHRVGLRVRVLERVAIGGLELAGLPPGAVRPLDEREIAALFSEPQR